MNDDHDQYLDEITACLADFSKVNDSVNAIAIALNEPEWKRLTAEDAEAQTHLEKARQRAKGYRILRGLLYYEDRLYVPSSKR